MTNSAELTRVIVEWTAGIRVIGKTGKGLLQPSLATFLRAAGFDCDEEDRLSFLQSGMPAWRSKDNWEVVPTHKRLLIDIVVRQHSAILGLIETESDLDDLRTSGVTRRNGHYDVASIAKNSEGKFFDSYKSLERMAAAAFYCNLSQVNGRYPTLGEAVGALEALNSDEPSDHNPGGVPLYLVSGSCRPQDPLILAPRLRSLGAILIPVTTRRV